MAIDAGKVVREFWNVFVREQLESLPAAERKAFSILLKQRERELLIDHLIRGALKISNPRDPDEVAKGLLARYS
jgi:hypothetical protein